MTAARPTRRYFVYVYRWRPNVSCEACCWLSQGSYEAREDADDHVARLTAKGERAKHILGDDL